LQDSSNLEVGFLVKAICPSPNFIVDGKRIQPDENSNNQPTPTLETLVTSGHSEDYTFTFNFYNLSELKQMAESKLTQYKVCGRVHQLSNEDRVYLRQFLSIYRAK
jgi:hypothetical protein